MMSYERFYVLRHTDSGLIKVSGPMDHRQAVNEAKADLMEFHGYANPLCNRVFIVQVESVVDIEQSCTVSTVKSL